MNWAQIKQILTDDGTTAEVGSVHENADLPGELVGPGLTASDDVGADALAHLAAGIYRASLVSMVI